MRAGWLRFGRKRAPATASAPDNAVRATPAWLLGAAIIASTAALLGTSDEGPPTYHRTYTFARNGVDGGFVELTRDQPAATFFVTLHADDLLSPDRVPTTDGASALIDGTLTTTDLDAGAFVPYVDVKLGTPGAVGSQKAVLEQFNQTQPLLFTGDCDDPKTSGSCSARFSVEVSRQDQGEGGGVVRFDWTFDVASRVEVEITRDDESVLGPYDPPWTIEVSQP